LRVERTFRCSSGANLYDLPRHERGAAASFAQLPSLMSIAASDDIALTERLAQLTAEHLKVMGFNLNLGPSLDLAPTIEAASGSVQHFGSNPNFAAVAGGSILAALTSNGILAMPMGFPGGGCNRSVNSPATLLTPRARLMEQDLLPFVRAVERGLRCCMWRIRLSDHRRGQLARESVGSGHARPDPE